MGSVQCHKPTEGSTLWGALSPWKWSVGYPMPPRGVWGGPWGARCPRGVFGGIHGVLRAPEGCLGGSVRCLLPPGGGVCAVPYTPKGCPGCPVSPGGLQGDLGVGGKPDPPLPAGRCSALHSGGAGPWQRGRGHDRGGVASEAGRISSW